METLHQSEGKPPIDRLSPFDLLLLTQLHDPSPGKFRYFTQAVTASRWPTTAELRSAAPLGPA